jgi:hypothetical protein
MWSSIVLDDNRPRNSRKRLQRLTYHRNRVDLPILHTKNPDYQIRGADLFHPFPGVLWDGVQFHSLASWNYATARAHSESDKIPIKGMRTQLGRSFNSNRSSRSVFSNR